MLDEDGYPTEEALKRIAKWPHTDWPGLLEFTQPLWNYPDRWWTEGDVLHLSTGGWSGNEDIIRALEANRFFWAICWISSRRGGWYEFDLARVKRKGGKNGPIEG